MTARAAFERLLVAVVDIEEYAEQGGNLDRDAAEVRAALPERTPATDIEAFAHSPRLGRDMRRDLDQAITYLRSLLREPRDAFHTMDELYDYRMLYNALAARLWYIVNSSPDAAVKSWRHSDGELCFGGGWFVVVLTLPAGQVTNHYAAEHWNLFSIPERVPPAYDGHTPAEAAERIRAFLSGAAS